jgi:hypothetical protein
MLARRYAIGAALATTGLIAGALVAAVSLPLGPFDGTAFAELTHNGGTPAAGTVHMAIDCSTVGSGTQDTCAATPWITTDLDIDVTIGNATGSARIIRRFSFAVSVDQTLLDPKAGVDANKNANPDANDVLVDGTWSCTPPPPARDTDPGTAVARSFIDCSTAGPGITLSPDPAPHVALATVHYIVTALPGFWSAPLTLGDVQVYDETGAEIMSCNPPLTNAGPCFGSTVDIIPQPTIDATPPTATPTTPTPTSVSSVGGVSEEPVVTAQPVGRPAHGSNEGVAAAVAVAGTLTLAAAGGWQWRRRRG